MTRKTLISLLALGLTLSLTQIVTSSRCFASEAVKTAQASDPVPVLPPTGKLPHALLSLTSESGNFSQYAFLVDKKARTLTVWQNAGDTIKLIGAWPADIGRAQGDKLAEGDFKTPEGVYFFQTSRDGHVVDYNLYGDRIFTLDYPNYFDKLDGKTGQGIWFHAIPETKSLLRGSRGCVVVRNKVINELAKYIELKRTPMLVVNEVEYLEPAKWNALKSDLNSWLETWRSAWGGKDLDTYMSFYGERFSGNGMSRAKWRRYKKSLADRYKFINVDLKDVQIFNQGPKVVFRFLQSYKSDQKVDYGAKILYALKNSDNRWEIIGETWHPAHAPISQPQLATARSGPTPPTAGSPAPASAHSPSAEQEN